MTSPRQRKKRLMAARLREQREAAEDQKAQKQLEADKAKAAKKAEKEAKVEKKVEEKPEAKPVEKKVEKKSEKKGLKGLLSKDDKTPDKGDKE